MRTFAALALWVAACSAPTSTSTRGTLLPSATHSVRMSTALVGDGCHAVVEVAFLEGIGPGVRIVSEVRPELEVEGEAVALGELGDGWALSSANWRRWASSSDWRLGLGDCAVRPNGHAHRLRELRDHADEVRAWYQRGLR